MQVRIPQGVPGSDGTILANTWPCIDPSGLSAVLWDPADKDKQRRLRALLGNKENSGKMPRDY